MPQVKCTHRRSNLILTEHYLMCIVVFFLSPTFTAILAASILGEAFTLFDGLCATLCMVGAILVSKPTFLFGGDDVESDSVHRALAVLAALVGALMAAIAYVTVRKIGKGAHFLVHTVYFGGISTVTSIPLLFAFQEYVAPEGWKEYGMLLMTGVLAFAGQCLLNRGYVDYASLVLVHDGIY